MQPTFIGVSPSLSQSAPGHYLPFHGKLHEQFRVLNPASIYLGAEEIGTIANWWTNWAPFSLRSRPNHLSWRKFNALCAIARAKENPFFVVYEGNLFHLLLFSFVCARTNSSALVNLHYSSELSRKLDSKFGKFLVRITFGISNFLCRRNLIITSESDELSTEIMGKIGVFPKAFPVFSVLEKLDSSEVENLTHHWVICRIVHERQIESLLKAIKENPTEIFLVNGLKKNQTEAFTGLLNVRIQDQHLTAQEYRALLASSKQIILAYDTDMYRGHSSGRLLDAMVFNKPILAIKGMPIPIFAREYGKLRVVDFEELSRCIKMSFDNESVLLNIAPNVVWAVDGIARLYAAESRRGKKLYSIVGLFGFALFIGFTFCARAIKSLESHLPGRNTR
jgi:hypothetical protein